MYILTFTTVQLPLSMVQNIMKFSTKHFVVLHSGEN